MRTCIPLLKKSMLEALPLLAGSALLLWGFGWLYVWLISVFDLAAAVGFLDTLPPLFRRLSSIPLAKFTDPEVMLSLFYVHPVVTLTSAVWAIARGSDVVSGEVERGTMEMILAQPVRRLTVVAVPMLVAAFGAGVLALAAFAGTATGLATVRFDDQPRTSAYFPVAVNLFVLNLCLCSVSAFVSSWDSRRGRTIGILGAFYVVQIIIQLASRMWPDSGRLKFFTILHYYEPQQMIADSQQSWGMLASHAPPLLALTIACTIATAIIFVRRDLPAPL